MDGGEHDGIVDIQGSFCDQFGIIDGILAVFGAVGGAVSALDQGGVLVFEGGTVFHQQLHHVEAAVQAGKTQGPCGEFKTAAAGDDRFCLLDVVGKNCLLQQFHLGLIAELFVVDGLFLFAGRGAEILRGLGNVHGIGLFQQALFMGCSVLPVAFRIGAFILFGIQAVGETQQ